MIEDKDWVTIILIGALACILIIGAGGLWLEHKYNKVVEELNACKREQAEGFNMGLGKINYSWAGGMQDG